MSILRWLSLSVWHWCKLKTLTTPQLHDRLPPGCNRDIPDLHPLLGQLQWPLLNRLTGKCSNFNQCSSLTQNFRHNEDGSYTYGYESADGSFKIETKLPTGEVKGKYGYTDDLGKVRVIEYGATKHGFAPAGEGSTFSCKI